MDTLHFAPVQKVKKMLLPSFYFYRLCQGSANYEDRSLASNHRFISLLSNIDKYLYNHILYNNILTAFQSGFILADSTVNHYHFSAVQQYSGKVMSLSSV